MGADAMVTRSARDEEICMKRTAYGDHLIQLTDHPIIFPVNTYLVREEDGCTLVDTGLATSGPKILAAARALGLRIARIALTHAHGDHVGGLDVVHAAFPDAEVSISARDARPLAGEMSRDPDEPQAKLRGQFVRRETQPTRLLHVGDRVGSLEVVTAPGHTPGQVAFLDTRDGTLIAGDAFQTRGGIAVAGIVRPLFPFIAMGTWHTATALETARHLRALNPTRLAIGHGPVLTDPLAAMDVAIAAAERKVRHEATDAR
jgi:glyoxylase-like metal-dependent hydrolase (beta-lactamase superfamily II)